MTAVLPEVSTEDREALRAAVAELLADRCTEADVRAAMVTPEGYDAALWGQLAQLGVLGLVVPDEHGGSGSTFEEVAVVLEELGRVLCPGPFLATTLATLTLLRAADPQLAARYLPQIAAGELVATVAVEQPARGAVPAPQVVASGGVLSGVVPYVLDGHVAQLLLVAASDGVYALQPGARGISTTVLDTADQTRRLVELRLDGAPGQRIGGPELVRDVLALGAAALACEQTGGAEAVLHATVGYAKVRNQFGRPIGSFQAIKHHCAEIFMGVESAKAAARRAAREVAVDGPELVELAAIAKVWCSDTYTGAAIVSTQIHGGIAYTWEHSAHLHLKRAATDELLFGDARHHRARLAEVLGV